MATTYGILLDLDETLVRTEKLEPFRPNWAKARENFELTDLPDGTREFLEEVATIGKIGIVTNTARETYAEPLLQHWDLPNIATVVGSRDVRGRYKPDPYPIVIAAQKIGCDPKNCIYIGDQPDDMEAAYRAGAYPIGIAWPRADRSFPNLVDAACNCRSWSEALDVIRDLVSGKRAWHRRPDLPSLPNVRWREHCLSVYEYGYSPTPHNDTYLVQRFKSGDLDAHVKVTGDVRTALAAYESVLRSEHGCTYIVAAPRHVPGKLPPNDKCERLCRSLESAHRWLNHLPAALERTIEVPQSSTASRNGMRRPTVDDHLKSIRYVGEKLTKPVGRIVLLDDVYTEGATWKACRKILQDATGCDSIVGLFVARTRKRPGQ